MLGPNSKSLKPTKMIKINVIFVSSYKGTPNCQDQIVFSPDEAFLKIVNKNQVVFS